MKKKRARLIACLLVCAIGVACSACGKSQSDSSNSDSKKNEDSGAAEATTTLDASELEQMQKQDMQFNYALEEDGESGNVDVPVNQGVNSNGSEDSYVVVTDEAGEPVTDSNGTVVTEVVSGGNSSSNNSGNSDSSTAANEESSSGNSTSGGDTYTADTKTFQAYWLDMSQGEDYVFNGDFIDVTFKIKDNAPDGTYALTSGACDFANWDAESVPVDFVDGSITVGDGSAEAAGTASAGTFSIVAGTAQGKQGDEVTIRFDMSDNPGIVALIFRFKYDANALEITNAVVGNDCSDYITLSES